MTSSTFDGTRAVVTGGGTGIGRATALALAARGAESVIITGRRPERLAEVAAESSAVVPVTADVATQAGADAVAKAVAEQGGRIDVLVHNAGVFDFSPVSGGDVDRARRVLDINLMGPYLLTRAVEETLAESAAIVFVSSNAGHIAVPQAAMYAASKAGVDAFVRSWAIELAPRRIRVNAVAPAAVRTEVHKAWGMSDEQVDEYFAFEDSRTPLGRAGTTDDVVPWIVQLADPASSWVTGQIVTLDGGLELG